MHKKRSLFIILIIFLGTAQFCFSQTYAYYKTRKYIKNYTWTPDSKLKSSGLSFPAFNDMESLAKSFLIPNQTTLSFLEHNNKEKNLSSLILVFRCFTENVASAEFKITDHKSHESKQSVKFPNQGYQTAFFLNFDSLSSFDKKSLKIEISFQNIDTKKNTRFVLGEMWLGNNKIEKHFSPFKIFTTAPYDNARIKNTTRFTPFESTGQYAHFPAHQYEEYYKSNVFIEDASLKSENTLSEVFLSLLKVYPFYAERNLNKEEILQKAVALFKDSSSFCDRVTKINTFLSTEVKDPHFSIQSKCIVQPVKALVTPLYCYNFNNKPIVSVILDGELEKKIPLGSEILEVNGKKITLDQNLSIEQLNQSLKNAPGENVKLRFINPSGETNNLIYSLKSKYVISKKYSGNKGDGYISLNDSTTYYKINSINDQSINTFISNLDSINTKKNLVLDFRNCGGGDFLAGARLLSSFIQKSFKYFDFKEVESGKLDSVVVNRHLSPSNFRNDGKISVIINRNSACVAELLTSCLKKERSGVKIIGSENSIGALSFTYQIVLPNEQASFTTNAISPGKILLNGRSIETKGITPDIWVNLEKVEDLAPYKDKVLQAAVSQPDSI